MLSNVLGFEALNQDFFKPPINTTRYMYTIFSTITQNAQLNSAKKKQFCVPKAHLTFQTDFTFHHNLKFSFKRKRALKDIEGKGENVIH